MGFGASVGFNDQVEHSVWIQVKVANEGNDAIPDHLGLIGGAHRCQQEGQLGESLVILPQQIMLILVIIELGVGCPGLLVEIGLLGQPCRVDQLIG